jgi:hypothetical protein
MPTRARSKRPHSSSPSEKLPSASITNAMSCGRFDQLSRCASAAWIARVGERRFLKIPLSLPGCEGSTTANPPRAQARASLP